MVTLHDRESTLQLNPLEKQQAAHYSRRFLRVSRHESEVNNARWRGNLSMVDQVSVISVERDKEAVLRSCKFEHFDVRCSGLMLRHPDYVESGRAERGY